MLDIAVLLSKIETIETYPRKSTSKLIQPMRQSFLGKVLPVLFLLLGFLSCKPEDDPSVKPEDNRFTKVVLKEGMDSGWMRATAPSGDANFEGVASWSGELGHGVRAPEPTQSVRDASDKSSISDATPHGGAH